MADDVVLLENRDGIGLVTLNRPERLNAWTGELENRYFDRLDECAADPDVKVIVVTGAGRGFCAGADMDMLQGIGAGEVNAAGTARTTRPQWHTTMIPKPVIAAINGACAGIGLVQALMADIRFAASGAKFTTAFARRGLIAEHGISWVLPKLVGPATALDLLMSGRVFLADEAARLGVVNDVIAPEHLIDHTMAYASDMAANCSPASMAVMKRQVWDHYLLPLDDATRSSNELMKISLKADDFREGVQSFVQKRPPKFAPLAQ
ncbi:MAG: enoyl-CoA hydratase [Acidimicrobiales bacterium]